MPLSFKGKPIKEMGLNGKDINDAINFIAINANRNTFYYLPGIEDDLDVWFLENVEKRIKYFRKAGRIK